MVLIIETKEGHSFKLRYLSEAKHWFLSNEQGEGMGLSSLQLYNLFKDYFDRNM
jgi:hypothetical protein